MYRMKFNETYAEMNKGTNEWKTILGGVLFFLGLTGLILIWQKHFSEYLFHGELGSGDACWEFSVGSGWFMEQP